MTLILNVWLEASAEPIGRLVKADDSSLAFAYTPEWLANSAQHTLSLSLPLGDEPFGDVPVHAFFDNLLQENNLLETVIRREGIDRGDIAALLAHVGADCAGAVSVLPLDHPPIKRPGRIQGDYDPLDEATFAEIVDRLATGRPLPGELRDPSPVAGVRPKISLTGLPDGRFAIPKPGSGAPTTHILKLPDPQHRHEARDEAFVTLLAAECGFNVGSSVASTIGGFDVLLIRRFDRHLEDGMVRRLHQEDFAQAAGLPAELKYQRKGTPPRCFDAATIGRILEATDRPAQSRETFLRMTLFNLLVGNNDNHAKNNALLHGPGGSITLAPFYDLVPVQTVAGFREDFAFHIGDAKVPAELTRSDLLTFCQAIGLPPQGAEKILARASRNLVERIETLSANFSADMGALDRLFGETAGELVLLLGLDIALRERDAHVVSGGGWALS
jgi:serine/threonine-protein kinase HipA